MRTGGLDPHVPRASPIHDLDARAKILALFGLIVVCVSTPAPAWPAFCGYLGFLAGLWLVARIPARTLLRVLVVLPFVGAVVLFVPLLEEGSVGGSWSLGAGVDVTSTELLVIWNVTVKALTAVTALVLLTATTPVAEVFRGLGRLGVPRILVMLGSFTYRYVFVLVDEALRMKRARDARAYGGRWLWQSGVVGQMIGTLFLRSYERSERIHQAMVSRGFDGTPPGPPPSKFGLRDGAFAAGTLALLLALRLGGT